MKLKIVPIFFSRLSSQFFSVEAPSNVFSKSENSRVHQYNTLSTLRLMSKFVNQWKLGSYRCERIFDRLVKTTTQILRFIFREMAFAVGKSEIYLKSSHPPWLLEVFIEMLRKRPPLLIKVDWKDFECSTLKNLKKC